MPDATNDMQCYRQLFRPRTDGKRRMINCAMVASVVMLFCSTMAYAETDPTDPIPAACGAATRSYHDPIYDEKTSFDRKRQKGWYWRWWTGECDRVPYPDRWTCVASDEQQTAWSTFIEKTAKTAASTSKIRSKVYLELCQLGEVMGLEWSKDNDVRCIHTGDLARLRATITKAKAQPLKAIEDIRTVVKEKLRCRKN